MNPIIPHRYVGLQLEQQILQNFRVCWELISLIDMVFQLRALGPPWSIIHVEDRAEECIKHLCLVPVPVTILNGLILFLHCLLPLIYFVLNMFLLSPTVLAIFKCNRVCPHRFFSYNGKQYLCIFPMSPGLAGHTPCLLPYFQEMIPV